MNEKYFVIQSETGLVDGWYYEGSDMAAVKERWDAAFPDKTHSICVAEKSVKLSRERYLVKSHAGSIGSC